MTKTHLTAMLARCCSIALRSAPTRRAEWPHEMGLYHRGDPVNGGEKLGHWGSVKMDHSMVRGLSMESMGGPCGAPWASLCPDAGQGSIGFSRFAVSGSA